MLVSFCLDHLEFDMYLIPGFVLAFLALFCEKKIPFKSPIVWTFSFLFLVFFIGFKFEVGTDWVVIYSNFNNLTSGEASFSWASNPLYSIISLISYRAGFSIYGVYVTCAVIFSVGLFSLLSRLSRPWLSLCCFYPYYIMVFSFNFDRQSAALGFAMLGISQLLDSRKTRYLLLLLLGALFHPTVLILLPLLFATESLTSKSYILSISAFFSLFLMSIPFSYVFISANMENLIDNYFRSGLIFESTGIWLRLLPLLFSSGVILSFRGRFMLNKFQFSVYSLLVFMVILLSVSALLFASVSTIIDRLSAYASPLLLLATSESPKLLKNDWLASSFVVLLLSVYSLLMAIAWLTFSFYAESYWLPYQNILIK